MDSKAPPPRGFFETGVRLCLLTRWSFLLSYRIGVILLQKHFRVSAVLLA